MKPLRQPPPYQKRPSIGKYYFCVKSIKGTEFRRAIYCYGWNLLCALNLWPYALFCAVLLERYGVLGYIPGLVIFAVLPKQNLLCALNLWPYALFCAVLLVRYGVLGYIPGLAIFAVLPKQKSECFGGNGAPLL